MKLLTDRGMFDSQAEAVLATAIPEINSLCPNYTITWDQEDGYPPQLYGLWVVILFRHALAWIDTNLPKAWYRQMFEMEVNND